MKKKKLAVIGIAGIAGMLYSVTPASAQTFYQCMPLICPEGQYLENGKCNNCPRGTYNDKKGQVGSKSCIKCPSGTGSWGGASKCEAPGCISITGSYENGSNKYYGKHLSTSLCLNETINCDCNKVMNLMGQGTENCNKGTQTKSYYDSGLLKCNGDSQRFLGKKKAVCKDNNNCLYLKLING